MHLLSTVLTPWIYSAVTVSLFCRMFLSATESVEVHWETT